jgi:hypothetical protein
MLWPRVKRLIYATTSQSIQEEDDPDQKQQMVVAGDHVLGAQ